MYDGESTGLPSGFQIVDEVDIGNVDDVKEERPLVPPAKDVKLQIKRVNARKNEQGTWRWLSVGLQLVDGVKVGEDMKYKGMYVNTDNMCYYADPLTYPEVVKDKRYLGKLADLQRATGTVGMKINDEFLNTLQDKIVLGTIRQKFDEYQGEKVNVVGYLKPLGVEQLV